MLSSEKYKIKVLKIREKFAPETMKFCTPCKGKCCHNCASAHGYLENTEFKGAKKSFKWDDKTGFLTQKGCSIPVKQRSTVCLKYFCGFPQVNPEIKRLRDQAYELACKIHTSLRQITQI